jgi:hypothetical protein
VIENRRGVGRFGSLAIASALAFVACSKSDGSTNGDAGAVDPGSLMSLELDSTVGFLLDDLPADQRDRAAQLVLAKPASFWQERARRQVLVMHQRLTYRHFFSILASGSFKKGQLPLPPAESWNVAVDTAGPKRTTVDGHDVVAVAYKLTGTLLSDVDSPGKADPALDPIGGTWDEPFVLPVDPDLLFQRTGYACVREAFDNAHSIDGENATLFYDDGCKGTENGLLNCHQSLGSWPVDCQTALQQTIGRVTTKLTFTRLPWDKALADTVRVGAPTPGGADLAVRTEGLANHRIVYRYFTPDSCALVEKCVGGPGWRKLLQFDASLKNVGDRDLKIGDSSASIWQSHNVFTYSACHKHNHFRFYGDFTYGSAGVTGEKKAFCLLSTTRYGNHEGSPLVHAFDGCTYQGIASGWGDDYFAGIDCQWLDVTDVDARAGDVKASLTFQANPDKFLCEGTPILDDNQDPKFEPTTYTTDDGKPIDRPMCTFRPGYDANNTGSVDAVVPQKGGLVTSPCMRGEISSRRDCGLSEQSSPATCGPNDKITLSCSVPAGAKVQVVRLCEASWTSGNMPCAAFDALGSGAAADGAPASIAITCPAPRDTVTEHGGKLSVYAGPMFDGDAPAPVTCVVK